MPFEGALEARPLLDVVQILAYSQQSGTLAVEGEGSKGLVIFDRGNVVCAYSPSALSLLVKAAKESDPHVRLSLRRVQILTALRELFDLSTGEYRFTRKLEPVRDVQGLDIRSFYASGGLDTGDLLLVLEKAMEEPSVDLEPAPPTPSSETDHSVERRFPRFGPIIIRGKLIAENGGVIDGYLTNLSEGGTFFHGDDFPKVGAEMELSFELPWSFGPCRTRARVVWARAEGPDARQGTGLSFVEFAGNSKVSLSAFLKRFAELASDVDFRA